MKNDRWRKVLARFWGYAGGVSVRTKIFGIVLGSTLLLSLGFTLQIRTALRGVLEQKSREEGVSIARDVAARSTDLILVNDLYSLHQLLAETQANFTDVHYAFIMDPKGQVLVHTFGPGFPPDLLGVNTVSPDAYQHTVVLQTNDGQVWDVAVPIFDGKSGTIRVGISDRRVRQTLADLTSQLGFTIFAVLTGSLLAATFLTWILTRPILSLVEATKKIAQGDFSPRVARWANDEIGDLAEAFNQMTAELARTEELRQEREQLRRQLLEGVITAQEDERRRISRELHDSASQSLTSLMVGLRMLETTTDPACIAARAQDLRETVRQTLDDLHTLAVQLRPAVLDDLGLETALQTYTRDYQERYQIHTELQTIGFAERRLSSPIETAVYRIIQEALTNAAKYAHPQEISILLEQRDGQLSVIVEDDGDGFDPQKVLKNASRKKQLGLYGMQERASQLGGQIVFESSPGRGSTIYVRIPLKDATNGKDPGIAGR